uniref:OBG-type G domain-containing protein n=1 Tax=Oryza punctata TaxID=4537 RepID=A0A0E0MID5_ORYPU
MVERVSRHGSNCGMVMELEHYQEGLTKRPSLIVANKIDEEGADEMYEELKKRVQGIEFGRAYHWRAASRKSRALGDAYTIAPPEFSTISIIHFPNKQIGTPSSVRWAWML